MHFANRIIDCIGTFLVSPFLYPAHGNTIQVVQEEIAAKYKIRPWTLDKFIIWEAWGMNEYVNNLITIKPKDTVVDIGAQIGVFSVRAAKLASEGRVFAYEPHPENYSMLLTNIQLNKCQNIFPYKMSIGKDGGEVSIKLFVNATNSGGHSTVVRVGKHFVTTPQLSLRRIFSLHKLNRVHCLKIDTEGSEFDILLTAPPSLFKKIDQIALEYHNFLASSRRHLEIVEFLKSNGFKVKVVNHPVISRVLGTGNIYASKDHEVKL